MRKTTWPTSCRILLLSILISAAAAADDWPQHRGPGRDGVWPRPVAYGTAETNGLTVAERWRQPIGAGYSGIAVVDGRLFTMTSDGEQDHVLALEAASGKEIWRTAAGPTRPGGPGQVPGPSSTPAVAYDTVFALTPRGRLLALATSDGSVRWQRDLVADFGAVEPRYGISTSPLVDGQRLVVMVGGEKAYLAAFDVATGDLVWSENHGSGPSHASPRKATLAGVEQIVVPSGETLYGVEPDDGTLLWSHAISGHGMIDRMPLVLPDDRLFLPLWSGGVMLAVHDTDGNGNVLQAEELWRTPRLAQNTHSPPLYHDDHLYGINGSLLVCISADDGTLRWRSRVYDGTLILVDGHLVVMSAGSGKLHLVKASPESFEEVLQTPLLETGYHTVTPPSYADRTLFIRNVREMVALDLRPADGRPPVVAAGSDVSPEAGQGLRELWRVPLAAGIDSAGNAGITVDGDRAFTIVTDADSERAVAIDTRNGKELWSRSLDARVETQDTGLASTPLAAGGRLFALSSACRFRALSADDGELLWQHDLPTEYGADDCRTSPRMIGDFLLLQTGGADDRRVVALRPDDGTAVWTADGAAPTTAASPVGATLRGVPQVLVHGYVMREEVPKSHLYGLRLADGKVLWSFTAEKFYSWSDPLVAGEHVMLPTWRHSYLLAPPAPDAGTEPEKMRATELWRSEMLDSAVYHDGVIFAYIGDDLLAVDAERGTILWRDTNNYGKVTLAGDQLLILAYNAGVLRLVDASRDGYRERARLQVVNPGAINNVPPVLAGRTILVRNQEEMVAVVPAGTSILP